MVDFMIKSWRTVICTKISDVSGNSLADTLSDYFIIAGGMGPILT